MIYTVKKTSTREYVICEHTMESSLFVGFTVCFQVINAKTGKPWQKNNHVSVDAVNLLINPGIDYRGKVIRRDGYRSMADAVAAINKLESCRELREEKARKIEAMVPDFNRQRFVENFERNLSAPH